MTAPVDYSDIPETDGILLCSGHTVRFNPQAKYGGASGCRVCVLESQNTQLTKKVHQLKAAMAELTS